MSLPEPLATLFKSVMELVDGGGPFVVWIYLCGVVMWTLVLERYWYFWRVLPRRASATIEAWMADRFGNYNILQGTSVSFATDAGAIDTSNVTDAFGITDSVYRTQNPMPTDVPTCRTRLKRG